MTRLNSAAPFPAKEVAAAMPSIIGISLLMSPPEEVIVPSAEVISVKL